MSAESVVVADHPTGLDLLAAATAFLLPVAYLPIVDAPFWTPKVAVLLPAAAVGLTCIPALLKTELRKATLAALVFLLVASISTALADDVSQAVFGLYNSGTGLIFIYSLVGVWALGASVTDAGRKRVVLGLVAGIGISAAVGVLQILVELGVPILGSPAGDRATGFAGHPVHLAALALGVVALAAMKIKDRWWWLVPVGTGAVVVQLAGSRFALLMLPLVVLAVLSRRGWRQAVAVIGCLMVGLSVGTFASQVGEQTTSSTSRITALPASGEGVSPRLETWLSARHPIADRPVFGEGPGRFRAATSPHRTLKLARAEGVDVIFDDAHNVVVEYAVTTGFAGLVSASVWFLLVARRIRDLPLAAFAIAVLTLHVVEPQSVATTPLLLLAAGVACRARPGQTPRSRSIAGASAAVGLGALALGATLVFGDAQLQRARLDFDDAASRSSVRLLAPWPNPATVRARIFLFEALQSPGSSAEAEALRWRRAAIDRAPDSSGLWIQLALDERAAGNDVGALAHFERALELDPWSGRALRGVIASARTLSDERTASSAERKARLLG